MKCARDAAKKPASCDLGEGGRSGAPGGGRVAARHQCAIGGSVCACHGANIGQIVRNGLAVPAGVIGMATSLRVNARSGRIDALSAKLPPCAGRWGGRKKTGDELGRCRAAGSTMSISVPGRRRGRGSRGRPVWESLIDAACCVPRLREGGGLPWDTRLVTEESARREAPPGGRRALRLRRMEQPAIRTAWNEVRSCVLFSFWS